MTPFRRQSILSAIAECDRFIDLEEKRDPALRPADVQKTLDFYKAHKARLQAMLDQVPLSEPPSHQPLGGDIQG